MSNAFKYMPWFIFVAELARKVREENRESVHWRHVSYANMQHTNPCSFELCSYIMNITQKNKDSAKNDKDYAKNGNKSI